MKILLLLALTGLTTAHMELTSPPPFRSKFNPFTTNIDYSMTDPLHPDNFPCKGYHTLLNTPQGASVATWPPGSQQTLSLTGSATHNGGSCQASLSYDKGQTFKVIKSWIGGCPLKTEWGFVVPRDAPQGEAIFAWSWYNNLGNGELYMNCAHITIGGGTIGEPVPPTGGGEQPYPGDGQPPPSQPPSDGQPPSGEQLPSGNWQPPHPSQQPPPPNGMDSRPAMFVANIGLGCETIEGSDVLFPNPGPDTENVSQKSAPPIGSCA